MFRVGEISNVLNKLSRTVHKGCYSTVVVGQGLTTPHCITHRSRDSIVSVATGYGLDDRVFGVRVLVGSRIFSSPRLPGPALGPTQLSIQWVQEALSPRVKRPGREADHSPPANAEVKEIWIYTSAPPYAFMP
jgi:hypothetical protein